MAVKIEPVDITTDGRTVWVNTPKKCIGRFCPSSCEVFTSEERLDEKGQRLDFRSPADWTWWCESLKHHHEVVMPEDKRPKHATPGEALT